MITEIIGISWIVGLNPCMDWSQDLFASRLTQALLLRGLTQKKLAIDTGIEETTLSNYKRGVSEPTLDALIKIANHLDVRVEWLVFGDEYEPMDDEEFELVFSWRHMAERERKAFTTMCKAVVEDRTEMLKKIGARTRVRKPALSLLPPVLSKKLAEIADMLNLAVGTLDPQVPEYAAVADAATQLSRLTAPPTAQSPKASMANASLPVSAGAPAAGTSGSQP